MRSSAPREGLSSASASDRQFQRRLRKAGWFVYREDQEGRLVTNAYPAEIGKLEELSGVACEIVDPGQPGGCARIGPAKTNA